VTDLIMPALIISGVYALSGRRVHLAIGVALAVVSLAGRGAFLARPQDWDAQTLAVLDYATDLPVLAFLIVVLFARVLHSKHIDWDTISGSICIYLLIGALWAVCYALALAVDPAAIAFNSEQPATSGRFGLLMYFSFVTLTTLGYGDIVPHSPLARSLAALEAVIGPLYLTIMIARLVGLHIGNQTPARGA